MKDKKLREEILKEIIDLSPLKPHGRYLLAPRFGKSRLIINLIKINKPNSILWITPLSELALVEIPKEFEKWKAKRFLKKLTTVTWTSLNTIEGHFDMVIMDEEQHITENNISSILSGKLTYDYLVSMTGTESKQEEKKYLYKKLGLDIIYQMDINEAVNLNILSSYKINVIQIPLGKEKNILAGSKQKPFMTSEEQNYLYLDKQYITASHFGSKSKFFKMLNRMRAIYNSKSKTEVAITLKNILKGRKIFFCASTDQAERISENFYHGKSSGNKLRDFLDFKIEDLAMVNKGGTGVTYLKVKHLILVQSDSDSNGSTTQKISRVLLKQKDIHPIIWILCLQETQDEIWVESALRNFDKSKIEYIKVENLENHEDIKKSLVQNSNENLQKSIS